MMIDVLFLTLMACGSEPVAQRAVVEVQSGPLVYRAGLYGELQAAESVPIFAPRTGDWSYFTIESVLDDGTVVSEGDVVLTFSKGPSEDELEAAETELAVATAELQRQDHSLQVEWVELDLEFKRRELALRRAQLGVVEGTTIISKLALERAKLDVARAEVELELARASLDAFEEKRRTSLEVERLAVEAAQSERDEKAERIAGLQVVAPADGVVYGPYLQMNWRRTKAAPGKVASPGDQILEIPDLSKLEAHVYARQRDAVLISEGDTATVVPTALPEQRIEATVKRKEAFATTRNERMGTETPEGNLKEVLVVLELAEAPAGLKPGATLRAELTSVLAEEALFVPLAAILDAEEGSVAVLDDGERRVVEVGKSTPYQAEIVAGLEEGERVRLGG